MYKNKKIILISFASKDLIRSAKRIRHEAENSKFYDEIKIFNEDDFDKDIGKLVKDLIKKIKKEVIVIGFGNLILFAKPLKN